MAEKLLSYKGKPLVRQKKALYYGDFSEEYYVMLIINASKEIGDIDVATRVSVQLHRHDPDGSNDTLENTSEQRGLYAALDMAAIWLKRALAE